MKTLTSAILAIVLVAATVALFQPGNTAGVLLALGAPFALFANVMASEAPNLEDELLP
jgi:succinate-acetate transporter protein